ncbi:hypothetical protein LINPERHAP2_LOCUS34708 [Linum perenne]
MEYMYLVSSPSVYLLGPATTQPNPNLHIASYAPENSIFTATSTVHGLIQKKGCKEMNPPLSKTDKKRKTRKKAKRNKSNAVSSSNDTSAGSSESNNGTSTVPECSKGQVKAALNCYKLQKRKSRGKNGVDCREVNSSLSKDEGFPIIHRQGMETTTNLIRPDDLLNLCDCSIILNSHSSSGKGQVHRKKNLALPGATDVYGNQQALQFADSRTVLPQKQLKQSLKGPRVTKTARSVSLNHQTGKENSYSVWQKVQRNDFIQLSECDVEKGSISKDKASKKSKRKSLHIFPYLNHVDDRNMVKCVPRISYKNSYPGSEMQTIRIEYVNHNSTTGFANDSQGINSIEPSMKEDKETSESELSNSLNQDELNKVDQTSKESETAELNNKQSHGSSGSVLQKWIPVGIIKEPALSSELNWDVEIPNSETAASDSPALDKEECTSRGDECVEKTRDPGDPGSGKADQDVAKACLAIASCYKDLTTYGVRLEGIVQAVHDTVKVQLASEAIEVATGCPIAEFERLLHSSSPSVSSMPNISLRSLWQWYEKHGIYGLEVRAEDHQNSSRLGIDKLSFRAYFVPFLSAVQLFGTNKGRETTQNNDSVHHVSENSTLETGEEKSSDVELLFEYFEFERPQLRQPLYEKIQELARGDGLSGRKMFGNPSTLVTTSLPELHKKSWYSVAWYPIYKIPDGSLRAAFLTYHSFGHLVESKDELGSPTMICPVVGLQSYNAQGECWFQPRHSAADHQTEEEKKLGSDQVLNERLRTLQETASSMARTTVKRGDEKPTTNWHPDYEFFLSRQFY